MKRAFLLSFSAFIMIAATSCTKKYDCVCNTDLFENNEYIRSTTELHRISAKSKASAENTCDQKNADVLDDIGYGYKTLCDLK